jgi:hypothetical protein
MTTVLVLLALIAGFAGLVHLTRNDRFSGPTPHDRFRDADGWLVHDLRNLFPR